MFNSPQYRNKISKSLIGHSVSQKTIDKIRKTRRERNNYGKPLTKEQRAKISKALKGKYTGAKGSMYGRAGALHPNWGKKRSPETRKKISEAQRGKKQSKELIEKRASALRGRKRPPYSVEWRFKIGQATKALWKDPEYRAMMCQKRSENSKKLCQDINYYSKTIGKKQVSPTRPEQLFNEMTPDKVRFIGDRQWWRTLPDGKFKNPDFKVTGQDKIIEIFGDYWHRNDKPQELIDLYNQIGLECLIIWESELYADPQEVLNKTLDFISA